MASYSRRPALQSEKEILFEAYWLTVGEYVSKAWGWDEKIQREGFWKHHPLTQFEVIEVEHVFAGGLHVVEDKTDLHIRMIYLLPAFQNHGIGSSMIIDIHTTAKSKNKGLRLKVINCNPVTSLYERLGFKLIDERNALKSMLWA